MFEKKMFFKILPSQILMSVMMSLNTVIDSIFAGHFLTTDEVSAIGFFTPFSNIIFLCYVFITGAQIICCQEIGKGKSREASGIFTTGFLLTLLYGLICGLSMAFAGSFISGLLGAEGDIADSLTLYLNGYALGAPLLMLSCLFNGFLQMNNRDDLLRISIFTMILSNALMDFIFIAVLGLGIFGLAFASSISSLLTAVIGIAGFVFTTKRSLVVRLSIKDIRLSLIPDIIRNGLIQLAFNLSLTIKNLFFNELIVLSAGQTAVSSMTVLNLINCFSGAFTVGSQNSELSIGSVFYGQKNKGSFEKVFKLSMGFSFISGLCIMIILMVLSGPLSLIFFDKGSTEYALSVSMIIICLTELPIRSIYAPILSAYQCQSKTVYTNVLTLVMNFSIPALAFILMHPFGINGVWMGIPAGSLFCILVMLTVACVKNHHIIRSFDDLMCFSADFNKGESKSINTAICNLNDCVDVSKKLQNLYKVGNISRKNAFYMGLCAEELLRNILEHSAAKDKCSIEISYGYDDSGINLHVWDDSSEFNPVDYINQFNADDPSKNIGLKIVSGISSEMKYQRFFGVNLLDVTI